jgi:hypothetical protein
MWRNQRLARSEIELGASIFSFFQSHRFSRTGPNTLSKSREGNEVAAGKKSSDPKRAAQIMLGGCCPVNLQLVAVRRWRAFGGIVDVTSLLFDRSRSTRFFPQGIRITHPTQRFPQARVTSNLDLQV